MEARHRCLIYDGSPARHLPTIAALIVNELKAQNRCLYLNSPTMVTGLRSYLAASGIDVAGEVRRGSLVLTSDQSQIVDGKFDMNAMLQGLADAVQQALRDGYSGLWASGDMTWEFGPERNLVRLVEYECALERMFQELPALHGVCQYHQDTLPPEAILTAISSHRAVLVNETLARFNPYYLPPEARAGWTAELAASEVQHRLQHLGNLGKL